MSKAHVRRPRRVVAAFAGVLVFSGTAFAMASPASASAVLQPVTVAPSVNGVAGAPAYTSQQTTVSFAVTNASTTGARLDSFTIVVPPGVGPVTNGGVTAPTAWSETILKCGIVPRCSALVVLNAKLPLKTNTVLPGGTVTATISFTTSATPGTLLFPLLGIGGGIFTVSGPTPSVQVLDGSATHFDVAVADPATAGTPAGIVVKALNVANAVVPFNGGSVTATLSGADSLATIEDTGVTGGSSATVSVPAAPSGTFTLSGLFTKAQLQSVQIDSGTLDGTSNSFTVQSGLPDHLKITSVVDKSRTPALPSPAANQPFAVGFTVYDAYDNLATTTPVQVTLSAPNASGGSLSPVPPTGLSGGDGTGAITATYSVAQAGLQLAIDSDGLDGDSASVDVVSAGDSVIGTPGQSASLTAGSGTAALPDGAFGPVFLTTAPCSGPGCGAGTEITLDGTFTNGDTHLYSFAAPAKVTWTCASGCSNYLFPFLPSPARQLADFYAHPIQVSLKIGGVYQPFATAPACRDPKNFKGIGKTGVIDSAAGKAAGFCVDVYAITRTGNPCTGALTIPVLFVEDPKLRPS